MRVIGTRRDQSKVVAHVDQLYPVRDSAPAAIIHQGALVAALQSGHLRGAALDVFEVEPLPVGDVLWSMPNVIICPHSASTAETENAKIVEIFIENIGHYLAGEPLKNLLDVDKQY